MLITETVKKVLWIKNFIFQNVTKLKNSFQQNAVLLFSNNINTEYLLSQSAQHISKNDRTFLEERNINLQPINMSLLFEIKHTKFYFGLKISLTLQVITGYTL